MWKTFDLNETKIERSTFDCCDVDSDMLARKGWIHYTTNKSCVHERDLIDQVTSVSSNYSVLISGYAQAYKYFDYSVNKKY